MRATHEYARVRDMVRKSSEASTREFAHELTDTGGTECISLSATDHRTARTARQLTQWILYHCASVIAVNNRLVCGAQGGPGSML